MWGRGWWADVVMPNTEGGAWGEHRRGIVACAPECG